MRNQERLEWLVPAGLVLLGLVPSVAGGARLAELAAGAPITPANERFFAMPLPVVLHIFAAVPFSLVGAFQFTSAVRRRWPNWHRRAGRVLVALGMLVALTGLWMARFYPWPEGDGQALYIMRLLFGSAMAASILLAVEAVRRRDWVSHGAWMTRAYAIGMGAGTQVFTHLPWFVLVGDTDVVSRAVLMGAGWGINLIVAEVAIRRHMRPVQPISIHVGRRVPA